MIRIETTEAHAAQEQTIDEMARTVTRLRLQLSNVRDENRRLRYRQRQRRERIHLAREARADAWLMFSWHVSGLLTSRRECGEMGLSERKWNRARALSMLAGIHDGRRFVTVDPQRAAAALDGALAQVEKDGIWRLQVRMARKD